MTGNFHVRFGGRERDVLERGVTLPTQCGIWRCISMRRSWDLHAVIDNQTAYLARWLGRLRDDRKLLIHAAAQAQHAADYILGRTTDSARDS